MVGVIRRYNSIYPVLNTYKNIYKEIKIKLRNGTEKTINLSGKNLDWKIVDANERELGTENLYEAAIDLTDECNDEVIIDLFLWEYPEGVINSWDIKANEGVEVLQNCNHAFGCYRINKNKNDIITVYAVYRKTQLEEVLYDEDMYWFFYNDETSKRGVVLESVLEKNFTKIGSTEIKNEKSINNDIKLNEEVMDHDNIKFSSTESSHIFFTSDTHFWHNKICEYMNRPFKNVMKMNDAFVNNWNNVVGKDDIVFHLGDFSFGEIDQIREIRNKLNGKIYLILGNHDRERYMKYKEEYDNMFVRCSREMFVTIGQQKIYMNHYPFLCYSGCRKMKPVWQLFGHVHSNCYKEDTGDISRLASCFSTQYDVGVDLNNYTPITFEALRSKITYQIKNNVNVTHWLIENKNKKELKYG